MEGAKVHNAAKTKADKKQTQTYMWMGATAIFGLGTAAALYLTPAAISSGIVLEFLGQDVTWAAVTACLGSGATAGGAGMTTITTMGWRKNRKRKTANFISLPGFRSIRGSSETC